MELEGEEATFSLANLNQLETFVDELFEQKDLRNVSWRLKDDRLSVFDEDTGFIFL
jgi:hypothetical protein